jgi:hypothetical protein
MPPRTGPFANSQGTTHFSAPASGTGAACSSSAAAPVHPCISPLKAAAAELKVRAALLTSPKSAPRVVAQSHDVIMTEAAATGAAALTHAALAGVSQMTPPTLRRSPRKGKGKGFKQLF